MNTMTMRLIRVFLVTIWMVALVGILVLPYAVERNNRGEFLIRNTVRLALLYWAIAATLMLVVQQPRVPWTLGCIAYLIHVGMAFEHSHHWSHTEAYEHVKEVGGVGEGIFVNYLFTLVWTLDVGWWWLDRRGYQNRPRWMSAAIHGFMVFMIVNGVVIFENGPIRWIGAVVLLGLGGLFWHRMTACRRAARD